MSTYKVTLHNCWRERYFLSDEVDESKKPMCRNINTESYEVNSKEQCKMVLKDFLDAPTAELTLDQVKKDFEDPNVGSIEERRLLAIQDYYNGRLALQNEIFEILDKIDGKQQCIYRFDIPFRCNYFACYADDSDEDSTHQESAYIEFEVTDNETIKAT